MRKSIGFTAFNSVSGKVLGQGLSHAEANALERDERDVKVMTDEGYRHYRRVHGPAYEPTGMFKGF